MVLNGTLTSRFRFAIDIDGSDRIARLVRSYATAVKDIIGADIEQLAAVFASQPGDVLGATGVDRESRIGVAFTAVDIGIGGGEHDPIRARAGDQPLHVFVASNIGVVGSGGYQLVGFPFPDEVLPEHSIGTDEQDTHQGYLNCVSQS